MKNISSIFLYIVTLLAVFVTITGFMAPVTLSARIFQILFVPVAFVLVMTSISHIFFRGPAFNRGQGIRRLFVYYCFIETAVMITLGFLSATTVAQIISALIFSSLGIYFLLLVWPRNGYVLEIPPERAETASHKAVKKAVESSLQIDIDRRDFLKLIGVAGATAFFFSLFNKKGLPFIGGNSSNLNTITDSTGKAINPAEKSLLDNYSITEIDDTTPIAYFGFVDDKGNWYIMKEDENGAFRYSRGENNFSRGWFSRESLSYGYFNEVF